jgi:UTP--glucose-1-phosphate uridylyltransferase
MLLREVAQCPAEDVAQFQDIARHRYFNTNNLWLDLDAVETMVAGDDGIKEMPLIRNTKPLDPADDASPRVYQLETAMGAAISVLSNTSAVRVPRSRFLPVNTTNDLLLLRSDCFERTREGFVRPLAEDPAALTRIDLDPKYFRNIDDFHGRFREAPSLSAARSLTVRGDVCFERGVIVRGDVTLEHTGPEPLVLSDRVLEGP